jgi:hypothetical protein
MYFMPLWRAMMSPRGISRERSEMRSDLSSCSSKLSKLRIAVIKIYMISLSYKMLWLGRGLKSRSISYLLKKVSKIKKSKLKWGINNQ